MPCFGCSALWHTACWVCFARACLMHTCTFACVLLDCALCPPSMCAPALPLHKHLSGSAKSNLQRRSGPCARRRSKARSWGIWRCCLARLHPGVAMVQMRWCGCVHAGKARRGGKRGRRCLGRQRWWRSTSRRPWRPCLPACARTTGSA